MPGIKELKTRIKSIGGMRKITRAMQLVSAAKMRKAQAATLASRTYSSLAWELITNLAPHSVIPEATSASESYPESMDPGSESGMTRNKLLVTFPKAKKIGVILISSNKGLVGSLNTNLINKLKEAGEDTTNTTNTTNRSYTTNKTDTTDSSNTSYRSDKSDAQLLSEIVTYGRKGKEISVRMGKEMAADFPKIDKTISTEDIFPLAKFVTEAYATGQYKKIVLVYNHFVSTISQKPTLRQLLPFVSDRQSATGNEQFDYLFEPDPKEVLEHLLPRIVESQIYQAILESDASEHSARMVMMKNATEAAGDLISDLTLSYNQLRQNKITTELSEITAGRIALE